MNKTVFISDLHLSPNTNELNDLFLKFLDYLQLQEIDALYILGDFFNYWIGNDNLTAWHYELSQHLKKISLNTKIYFMVGNRDFLVNNRTAEFFGWQLIPQDIININIYDYKVTILHGDTLCVNDTKYQFFRKVIRSPLIKTLYRTLPIKMRQNLAQELKSKSKRNFQQTQDHSIFDADEAEVLRVFNQMNTKLMIHGHTHQPKVHHYTKDHQPLTRYVLGDWHADGAYYLEVSQGRDLKVDFELKFFGA